MSTATHDRIKEHMEVVCCGGSHVGTVDHAQGDTIKLTKNDSPDGKHHTIPMSVVDHVDAKVHLNRTTDEVQKMWGTVD